MVEILDPLMTEHTFEDHDPSVTYYYAVTAFDSKGMESGYSNEASKSF